MGFVEQIKIAVEENLPLQIHSRSAERDTLMILLHYAPRDLKIHMHACFNSELFVKILLQEFKNSFIGISCCIENWSANLYFGREAWKGASKWDMNTIFPEGTSLYGNDYISNDDELLCESAHDETPCQGYVDAMLLADRQRSTSQTAEVGVRLRNDLDRWNLVPSFNIGPSPHEQASIRPFGYSRLMRQVKDVIPLSRILVETDAPYLPKIGYDSETRSKTSKSHNMMSAPSSIPETIQAIAKLKNLKMEEVALQLRENVKKVYGL